MPIRALLLDFDGLVCDTEAAARRSWDELYRERGLAFPPRLWAQMVGRADGEAIAVADLARRIGRPVDAAMRAQRRRRKAALCSQEPLRPGVDELTAAAGRLGLTVAVVSSSSLAWVQSHLVRLGIRDRIHVVVTGDDVARPKPAPDLYRAALARTGVPAADALAFEDSATGIRAARAAGVRCVAVPSSAGDRDALRAADVVLDSLLTFSLDVTAVTA